MGTRSIVEKFEADLFAVPEPRFLRREMGELERKKYADGGERLKISFGGLKDVPSLARVAVVIDDTEVCQVTVEKGRGRLDLRSEEGASVPSVAEGQVVEIRFEGQALLRGTFQPD